MNDNLSYYNTYHYHDHYYFYCRNVRHFEYLVTVVTTFNNKDYKNERSNEANKCFNTTTARNSTHTYRKQIEYHTQKTHSALPWFTSATRHVNNPGAEGCSVELAPPSLSSF